MDDPLREMEDLELALLRRGVDELAAELERCAACQRTPLVGERVYSDGTGLMVCELCRPNWHGRPLEPRLIHGPEFGHTMKLTDRRAAA